MSLGENISLSLFIMFITLAIISISKKMYDEWREDRMSLDDLRAGVDEKDLIENELASLKCMKFKVIAMFDCYDRFYKSDEECCLKEAERLEIELREMLGMGNDRK